MDKYTPYGRYSVCKMNRKRKKMTRRRRMTTRMTKQMRTRRTRVRKRRVKKRKLTKEMMELCDIHCVRCAFALKLIQL